MHEYNGGYVDGSAQVAEFDRPVALAVDSRGFVFVADLGNKAVRQVAPDGTTNHGHRSQEILFIADKSSHIGFGSADWACSLADGSLAVCVPGALLKSIPSKP